MKRCAAFGRNDCVLFLLVFFEFCVFSDRSTSPTTSGGSIFLLVKKDRGERHAKGLQSRPLESCFYTGVWRGDVRRSYEFAQMQFTRFRLVRWRAPVGSALGVPAVSALHGSAGKPSTAFLRQFHCRKHCFRRTLAYCTKCSEIVGTHRITNALRIWQSGCCGSANYSTAPHPKGTSSGDADAPPSGRSTQRQGNKRQRRSRLNRVKRTVARR